MAEGGNRPPSRNADMQTEPVKQFPLFLDAKARKTLRSNEKRRLTNLSKRVEQHMNDLGSRTELSFLRKELSNQLEECIRAHNLYRQSFDLAVVPSDDWIVHLENATAMLYGRIDEYIRTVNRPPSTAPSNPRSIGRSNPASVRSNSRSVHSNPGSVRNNPVSVRSNPDSVRSNPVSAHNNPTPIHSNPTSMVQNNPASVANSIHSQISSAHFGNIEMPQGPHNILSEPSDILYDDISLDFETVQALRRRLDQEKRARESLKEKFEQLQSNFQATDEELKRRNQSNAGAPSKVDIDFLTNTVKNCQAAQDQEKERRISLEQKLEKHRRELEEEKLARQADIHRFEREKERELDKLRTSFEEKLARHTAATSHNRAPPENPMEGIFGGARPKYPQTQQPSSTGQNKSSPPPYKQNESTCWWEPMSNKEEKLKEGKIIDSSNWSFDVKDNQNSPSTGQAGNTFSVFRLPKMDIKPFDGNPKNWQDFIAIFRDLVHNNINLTTTEKMAILKRCLTQEIKDGLGDSLSSPALYSEALKELESTYGHPSLISRTYFQSLIQLQRVNNNDYKALLKFSQTVSGAVASLKNGGYHHELLSSGLLDTITMKLPSEVQSRWGRRIAKSHPVCLTLQDFSSWLSLFVKGEMMAKHCIITPSSSTPLGKSSQKPGRQNSDAKPKFPPSVNSIAKKQSTPTTAAKQTAAKESKTLTCLLCKGDHRLASCSKFTSASMDERIKVIKEFRCCIRCLSRGHQMADCLSRKKCNVGECGAHHHPLLHGAPKLTVSFQENNNNDKTSDSASSTPNSKKAIGAHAVDDDTTTLLLVVPVIIEANGVRIQSVGLLDEGSQTSLIRNSLSKRLGLQGPLMPSPLSTYRGDDPKEIVRLVSFYIESPESGRAFEVKSAYAVQRVQSYHANLNWETSKHLWSHLADIQPIEIDSSEIGVLLGRNILRVHDVLDTRYPADGVEAPDGIKTHFGWCITGPVPTSSVHPSVHINSISGNNQQLEYRLYDLVTQFWLTESFGTRPSIHLPMTQDDKMALKILERTTRHNGDRYEVGLMLRNPSINLPNNREVALRQYRALIKRFTRDAAFAERYSQVLNEYIALGHAKQVDDDSASVNGSIWYLPHHGVTTPNKPGKVRVVFNPSAPHKGTSLNEQLYKGPDLLTCLNGVLLRFRQYPYPISGDIEKMYHQVLVPQHQQSLLRFLWNESGDASEPKEYQMKVHVFGAVSSPTSCIYALRKTVEDFGNQFPHVADAVLNNIYVDNYLDSTETEQEAISKIRDVSALLKLGGFNMVQWLSSSRSILASVDQSDLSRSLDLDADKLPIERTLGLLWDCQQDSFTFKSRVKTQAKTKRQVLQEVASVFDPLGFLAPVVMTAKILLQDIWRSGADWDDPLPPTLTSIWTSWANELQSIVQIKIPRCFRSMEKPIMYEIHVCSDASELGFGACVYLRAEYPSGKFRLNLILAKARVAPLRQLSIPRLELQGAVLGVRLCESALKELGPIASNTFFWCDSQTVLQWIHSKSCRYHAFVAHRITEILDSSAPSQWRHIPGELNPADDCSRGIPATHLTAQHRWFRGPDFLSLPQNSWPTTGVIKEPSPEDPEVSPSKCVGHIQVKQGHPLFKLIQNSSNLHKVKRSVAWLLRFVNNRHIDPQNRLLSPFLKAPELREALRFIIRVDQRHFFNEEMRSLTKKLPVSTASPLATLTPFLDPYGIIRVGGRLQHSSLPQDTKHPIVLSHESQLSTMVITDIHKLNLHSSSDSTLHALRAQYHVLHPRTSINRVIRNCFTCKQRKSQPETPLMGPLPASRIKTHLPPFTNVGIDFFGPLYVVLLRRSFKRYGVMFTCLDCRAVHLELADSLDMDSFINAFSRFVDRRGLPQLCYSDNGTNLVSGEQEINRALSRWNNEELVKKIEQLKNHPVEWRFSPPVAPHFGGSWERLIKSAKSALRGILNERSVTEDVLLTALVGAEALLNSRPLTHVSVDPDDLEALTPNHFLLLRAHPGCHLDSSSDSKPSSRKRYQQAQEMITHFWNRWLREYIPNLIERRKWLRHRRNIAVNDLVLVVTPNSPRGTWPIGRVTAVTTGPDGVVRSADVKVVRSSPSRKKLPDGSPDPKITTHYYSRSVHKLCLLEEHQPDVSEVGNRAGNERDS